MARFRSGMLKASTVLALVLALGLAQFVRGVPAAHAAPTCVNWYPAVISVHTNTYSWGRLSVTLDAKRDGATGIFCGVIRNHAQAATTSSGTLTAELESGPTVFDEPNYRLNPPATYDASIHQWNSFGDWDPGSCATGDAYFLNGFVEFTACTS